MALTLKQRQQKLDLQKWVDSKRNGKCDYFKAQAKKLRQNKRLKKNIIVF